MEKQPNTVILVTRDGMGDSEQELRHTLIDKYLQLMVASDLRPGVICFYADGVKLVLPLSPVIDSLKILESRGVHIIICSTCLNFHGLLGQNVVGIVGGMSDILEAQWRAEKVITI